MKDEINTDALQNLYEQDTNPKTPNEETTTSSPSPGKYNLIKKRGVKKMVDPRTLTFPPVNIYDERSEEEEVPFRQNIADNGILQTPCVKNTDVIIGKRRVKAAIALGIPLIEVEEIDFDADDVEMVVISRINPFSVCTCKNIFPTYL
ncbi:MAG: hypothetical protein ACLQQ4_07305 [Bacteroidia bacterium]